MASVIPCDWTGLPARFAAGPPLLAAPAVGAPSVLWGGKDGDLESRGWSQAGYGTWGRAPDLYSLTFIQRLYSFSLAPWNRPYPTRLRR